MDILRKTMSVCPKCIEKVPVIKSRGNQVFLIKNCKKHGQSKVLISNDSKYYKSVSKSYYAMNDKGMEKRNYYNIYVTLNCNLCCPICLTTAHRDYDEPSLDQIQSWVSGLKNTKIGLWGGEPTVREDLPEIIKIIKKSGNSPALYSNGIKLISKKYIQSLIDAGLEIVHMQFDGFDDNAYKVLRGVPLLKNKLQALKNLEEMNVPVILETTFARNLNENEIGPTIDFAESKPNIKAVLIRSYSHLGGAGLSRKNELLREELIDFASKQTNYVTKEYLALFQKLLYVFYDFLNTKRCFYNHYLMVEKKKGPAISLRDLRKISKIIDRYHKDKSKILLALRLTRFGFNIRYAFLALRMIIERRIFKGSFTAAALSSKSMVIGFGNICNTYTYDACSAKFCIGGEISTDYGIVDTLVESNLMREKNK